MMIWPILIIIIIIYFFSKNHESHKSENKCEETPLDILKKRYAKGEITKEEFEERKKELDN